MAVPLRRPLCILQTTLESQCLKGPEIDQSYVMRYDANADSSDCLTFVGFPDEYRWQKKNRRNKYLLYLFGNQIFVLFDVKHLSVGTSIAVT